MDNIFVLVVTYNGKQWYDRCVGSLQNSKIPVNVVVIDNASSDDTVSYLKVNYPEIHLIESETNLGFGQANNKGIHYALDNGADYVFLLNQDAWIESDTIGTLIEVHKKKPEYGVLSPMHLNAQKTAIEKGLIVYLSTIKHTPNELINDMYLGYKKEVYDTNYVNAAAWLLPRKTLETVGGFDPLFYHYGEDDNYLTRVLYHGFKVGIVPKVTICHDTERRLAALPKAAMNFNKWLLQRSTDLGYPDNHVDVMIKEYFKQTLIKFITVNRKTFLENYHNLTFLLRNKKNILKSRNYNKQKGSTWL